MERKNLINFDKLYPISSLKIKKINRLWDFQGWWYNYTVSAAIDLHSNYPISIIKDGYTK